MRVSLCAATLALFGIIMTAERARADMISMEGVEPWEMCGECHGLDGAGNRIKFPRLAGQKPSYIVKQLHNFREGRRKNDGGQMQKTATEIEEKDIPRVAEWFAKQTAPWPKPTIDAEPDLTRARKLSLSGVDGLDACLSCHSAAALGLLDRPIVAPRIAGQYDYYIAKQLIDYRDGRRSESGPDQIMTKIARRLSDADIIGLAVFLSQNPALHDEVVP
jgi:cytochrome c553